MLILTYTLSRHQIQVSRSFFTQALLTCRLPSVGYNNISSNTNSMSIIYLALFERFSVLTFSMFLHHIYTVSIGLLIIITSYYNNIIEQPKMTVEIRFVHCNTRTWNIQNICKKKFTIWNRKFHFSMDTTEIQLTLIKENKV